MIIYNVTVKVEASIAADWLQWLKNEHIPDVLATGCFEKATTLRLLEPDESEDPTFAIQYEAPDKQSLNRYLEQYATEMRARGASRWGNRFVAFRSILEVIN